MKSTAKLITDAKGTQYHIGCKPGDIAEYIMLVGDPARAEKVSAYFSRIDSKNAHREFVTITGIYKNLHLTVMATGIGPDNTEIAVVELAQLTQKPTLIRCGSCSSLKPEGHLGQLAISRASMRMDATMDYYAPRGYPAAADTDIVLALALAAERKKQTYHVGLTASAPGFYAAQGREVPGFPIRNKKLIPQLQSMNILNLEMETGALFTLAQIRGLRAGAVCAIYGNRHRDEFLDESGRTLAEKNAIEVTLEAFEVLNQMDQQKKTMGTPIWIPKEI